MLSNLYYWCLSEKWILNKGGSCVQYKIGFDELICLLFGNSNFKSYEIVFHMYFMFGHYFVQYGFTHACIFFQFVLEN